MAIPLALVFGRNVRVYDLREHKNLVLVMTVVALVLGQLLLKVLPVLVKVATLTNPLLILVIITLVLVLVYGVYVLVRRELGASSKCIVCRTNPRTILLRPCNHFGLCSNCVQHINNNHCPYCNARITKHERIYVP